VSERSDELRRQRDLLRENLAWIEKEIEREDGLSQPAPEMAAPPRLNTRAPVDDRDVEAILGEYRTSSHAIASSTKAGCIAYFAIATALLLLGVAGVYFYYKSARGH